MKIETLAKYVSKSKRFLIGPLLTYLDFYLYELLELIDFTTEGKIFDEYPELAEYRFRVSQLPKLKEYLTSDHCLLAPFNMKFAKINNWPVPGIN